MIRARTVLSVVVALYLVTIVALAFTTRVATTGSSEASASIQCAVASVLLVLLLGRRRWWVALGFAVLGAAWIEAAQSVWMPPGYATIGDVIAGAVGATVGAAVTVAVLRASRRANSAPRAEPHEAAVAETARRSPMP